MGNSGSSIGDIFYPDNPKRRQRCLELSSAINMYIAEFEQLKAQRDNIFIRIRPQLDKLLKDKGFNTPAELERKVREVLNSAELKKYDDLRKRLDLTDKAESAVWDIIGLVSVGSGVIVGVGFLAGFVTAGAAWAALGAVGVVLAIVTAVLGIFAIVMGGIQRTSLRNSINDLWFGRAEVKQHLEHMRAIYHWAESIESWITHPDLTPDLVDNLLVRFVRDYEKWTVQEVDRVLASADSMNKSWTNEDPRRWSYDLIHRDDKPVAVLAKDGSSGSIDSHIGSTLKSIRNYAELNQPPAISVLSLTPRNGGGTHTLTLQSQKATRAEESFALDENNQQWHIVGKPLTGSLTSDLDNVLFDFKCAAKQISHLDCWVRIVRTDTT